MRFESVPAPLLDRCRQGHADAFEELCKAIQGDIYACLLNLLRNHEDAADAMQECLDRLYRFLPSLERSEKFAGWMMRIIINQANTARVARARILPLAPDKFSQIISKDKFAVHAAAPTSPLARAEANELFRDINQAIDQLPERQRESIVLYEIEQLSIREISQALGCSEGAIKFHLHEARKKLRTILIAYRSESESGKGSPHA